MTRRAKILVVLLCFASCAAGTFIAPSARNPSQPLQKANAIPVKNHEIVRRVWVQV